MTKQLPLHKYHENANAKIVEFAGYEMPIYYTSIVDEHMAVREEIGVFDVSHMGEFMVSGEGATEFIQKVTTNDVSKLKDGDAQYSCLTNEDGGIIDDLIVYRLKDDDYMLVVNASNRTEDLAWLTVHQTDNVSIEDVSDTTVLLALQGPKAKEILQKYVERDLGDLPFYKFWKTRLKGIDGEVILSNTGYTGSGGYEIYIDEKDSTALWKVLTEIEGVTPCGLGARDTLRLEKGYCLHGNDISKETNPLEAGLAWITKLKTDFIGKRALLDHKKQGLKRRLIGFKMDKKGIPRQGYEIVTLDTEQTIGTVTSGGHSPMLEIGIGLGYVDKKYADLDTDIGIRIRKKIYPATVQKLPFV